MSDEEYEFTTTGKITACVLVALLTPPLLLGFLWLLGNSIGIILWYFDWWCKAFGIPGLSL